MSTKAQSQASQPLSTLLSADAQIGLPTEVSVAEISRERSLGSAMELCAKAAGYELDKTLQQELGVDKAQFSRWHSGQEGILWPKLVRLMDRCGNDAPLLWMLQQRGYDLHSLRKCETEIERQLRKAKDRIAELEREREITMKVLREVRA